MSITEQSPSISSSYPEKDPVVWTASSAVYDSPLIDTDVAAEAVLALRHIKQRNDSWRMRFDEPNEKRMHNMIDDIEHVLAGEIDPAEIEHSHSFIRNAFDHWQDSEQHHDGSFAFVVPSRLSTQGFTLTGSDQSPEDLLKNAMTFRDHPGNDYLEEVLQVLPVLRHLDPETRIQVFSAICPFVFETYGQDDEGRQGMGLFTPVFADMAGHYKSVGKATGRAVEIVNDAVDFIIRRHGIGMIGLGATLPNLTRFGRKIESDVATTTGHAGTDVLINLGVKRAVETEFADVSNGKVGFLGLGSIGAVAAENLLRTSDLSITVHDSTETTQDRVVQDLSTKYPGRVESVGSVQGLVDETRLVVSAVTSRVKPEDFDDISSLDGLVVLDDSEPGAFTDKIFEELGTQVLGVVGRASIPEMTRSGRYNNYGEQLASSDDVYGCEAQVGAEYFANGGPTQGPQRAVTMDDLKKTETLFLATGVNAAPLQRNGVYLQKP